MSDLELDLTQLNGSGINSNCSKSFETALLVYSLKPIDRFLKIEL